MADEESDPEEPTIDLTYFNHFAGKSRVYLKLSYNVISCFKAWLIKSSTQFNLNNHN